ncbi:MAG: hypothetical protein HY318_05895, partial [Armatimonadetes bacterium]|nr:hypothetical protein [Armatimonadota bacterium]
MKRFKLNPFTLASILGFSIFRSSLFAAGPREIAAQVNTENMRKTVSALSSIPSRVNGYDDGKPGDLPRSTQWVKEQFVALGLKNVREEPFDVTTPIDKKSQLFLKGSNAPIALRSLWPNLVRTNQTPPEGITGDLIYAGKGDLRAYNG